MCIAEHEVYYGNEDENHETNPIEVIPKKTEQRTFHSYFQYSNSDKRSAVKIETEGAENINKLKQRSHMKTYAKQQKHTVL